MPRPTRQPSAAVRVLAALGVTTAVATAAHGQAPAPADAPPPAWELARRAPDDFLWSPLLRLRAAEGRYRAAGASAWGTYAQLRAQQEASMGDAAAALRLFDAWTGGRDSVGSLPAGTHADDALATILGMADTARVVMVNERHHAAADRLLTLRLLAPLRARGYRYLAAEAFDAADSALGTRPWAHERRAGPYVAEPVFGEIVREARRLGYVLVPYEVEPAQGADTSGGLTPQQRRDRAQARNLVARTLARDPQARVLVHAGFAHVQERATPGWSPMAGYLRELTGLDPVTVDQTALGARSVARLEHPARRAAAAAGLVRGAPVVLRGADGRLLAPAGFGTDVEVLGARAGVTAGRPDHMALDGRRVATVVAVPECATRACVVEARLAAEPDEAVAADRAEAVRTAQVRLWLPPGTALRVRVVDADVPRGTVLRTATLRTSAAGVSAAAAP